jgi:hypothetical protein
MYILVDNYCRIIIIIIIIKPNTTFNFPGWDSLVDLNGNRTSWPSG